MSHLELEPTLTHELPFPPFYDPYPSLWTYCGKAEASADNGDVLRDPRTSDPIFPSDDFCFYYAQNNCRVTGLQSGIQEFGEFCCRAWASTRISETYPRSTLLPLVGMNQPGSLDQSGFGYIIEESLGPESICTIGGGLTRDAQFEDSTPPDLPGPSHFNNQVSSNQQSLLSAVDHPLPVQDSSMPATQSSKFPGLMPPPNASMKADFGARLSSVVYFISGDTVYCFDTVCLSLFEIGSFVSTHNVPSVPTPAPLVFSIRGRWYMRSVLDGKFSLQVRDEWSRAWKPVSLYEDLSQARIEQSRLVINNLAALRDFSAVDSSILTTPLTHEPELWQFPSYVQAMSADINICSHTGPSGIPDVFVSTSSGRQQDNLEVNLVPRFPTTPPQVQPQMNPPFHLGAYAGKEEIDTYCERLAQGAHRNILCPFCGGRQDRVSGLKRHLYFRFRIEPYPCSRTCGEGFSTKKNAERHSERCHGVPSERRSRSGRVPRCQISTKPGVSRHRSINGAS